MAGSEETLLLLRSVLFSLYPLMFAVGLLKRSDKPLDRKTLRAPFFSQCYLGGLLASLVSASIVLGRAKSTQLQIGGVCLLGVSVVWYMVLQALWFSDHLPISRGRGAWLSVITFTKATFINLMFALVITV